jgi:cytochrome c peroxidase
MTRRASLVALLVVGCARSEAEPPDLGPALAPPAVEPAPSGSGLNPRLLRRFRPLRTPETIESDAMRAEIQLGKALFFDPRLSRAGDTSCNTCHPLDTAGTDRRPLSRGVRGALGTRNTPTVFNAAWHVAQFWDGRTSDIDDQAKGPILNAAEMGMRSPEQVVAVLGSIPDYVTRFKTAFPGSASITFDDVAAAIGEFERTLTTPSRWDNFLRGDARALSDAEVEGLKVFADVGCVQCHTGELVGGSMFQRVGVASPWPNQQDPGREAVTKLESDHMVFKVPSLRNVVETAPYFHDGSVAALPDAIRMMARHQLGLELSDGEVGAIATWLGSLTGVAPRDAVAPPELPPDGPTTAAVMAR